MRTGEKGSSDSSSSSFDLADMRQNEKRTKAKEYLNAMSSKLDVAKKAIDEKKAIKDKKMSAKLCKMAEKRKKKEKKEKIDEKVKNRVQKSFLQKLYKREMKLESREIRVRE